MSGFSHVIHFILTLLTGFLWLPVWIICSLCAGSSNRKKAERKKDEELSLLRELVNNSKGKYK